MALPQSQNLKYVIEKANTILKSIGDEVRLIEWVEHRHGFMLPTRQLYAHSAPQQSSSFHFHVYSILNEI